MSSSTILVQIGTPALILAPMEGVTDAPMRALLSERGGFNFCVSEFLRITQEVPPRRTFFEHAPELRHGGMTESGVPVQVQLLGGDPERLAQAAQVAHQTGAQAIDLNFGCPSPTVNKHDGGATLLKYPDRIKRIVSEVRRALPKHIPVSAKLRLGWDDPKVIHLNADMVTEAGASWITIHGRTRLQGYMPPAYWKPIGEVQKRLNIPVIANGEIWTLEDFKRCREETQCSHFMIGRGALANPILPIEIAYELKSLTSSFGEFLDVPVNWNALINRFAEISTKYIDSRGYLPCRIKQWARMIHQRSPISWYETIKPLKSIDEILQVLESSYHELQC